MSENTSTPAATGEELTAAIQRLAGPDAAYFSVDEAVMPADPGALQRLLIGAQGHAIRVNPAALPADTWITYEQFRHLMGPGAVQRASFEKYSKEGTTIAGRRLSPKSHMVFRAGDVAQMLVERAAALEVGQ